MKPALLAKQPLAAAEHLFLPILPVRCLLIAKITPRRRENPKQQSSLLDRLAPALTLLLTRRHKTPMQR